TGPRIRAEHVEVKRHARMLGELVVTAVVHGTRRDYVVDLDPDWASDWLCTCGHGPDCAHIRATKAAIA
ncbi:MAG: hypothetical protein ACRD0W_05820, partial [Acidimicrobiales bacterium]